VSDGKQAPRFAPAASPATVTIDGTWDVLFVSEKRDTTRNVGALHGAG
jgi:hypothetical protein